LSLPSQVAGCDIGALIIPSQMSVGPITADGFHLGVRIVNPRGRNVASRDGRRRGAGGGQEGARGERRDDELKLRGIADAISSMDTDSDLSVYRRALHFSLAGEAERAALRTSKECCFQCDPSVEGEANFRRSGILRPSTKEINKINKKTRDKSRSDSIIIIIIIIIIID